MTETRKAKVLRLQLEALGFENVRVWWETLGIAMEMCGPSGGWLVSVGHREYPEVLPMGLSFAEAADWISHYAIRDLRP